MAETDSTAPFCPNVPQAPLPSSPLGRPFYPYDDETDPRANLRSDLAGISMAINALTGLLANSESFRDQQACNALAEEGAWPLPPACVEGLFAAVHFLSRYGESLSYRYGERCDALA
ncbi:hypothetical protein RKE25_11385 [Dyella sp. BiH032]|uniref:hypothetical protein n=1 Tax=Dyella sp. BiH032 TaxID=3075430 RepID=UPI002893113C|nr:hypothetical protein [Dyella sp. BiH032]WNL44032.1 hypothetical protein RKE25_11385 [Dyella sp. BiH032]